jgi:hypothetical protein
MYYFRTGGEKIKITPYNIQQSPAMTECSFNQTFDENDLLGVDTENVEGKRESVSEPLSAPPGEKSCYNLK